ncbi:MAG: hypothetical protein JWR67_1395, partial [Mucilaginibacter sp.]|nr:hypothetical protein [Mucilaginibacter sp.]
MILTSQDFILLCFQFPLCLWLVKYLSKRVDENLRSHFKRGIILKLIACIVLGLIYQFYYGFGDTLMYFNHSKFLTGAIVKSPKNTFSYLFSTDDEFYSFFSYYIDQLYEASYYFRTANITMIKIAAVFNFISLNSFFGTGFIFCFFSYFGQWKIFTVFYRAYPDIGEKFAYSLYIPSVIFWSSGILKDSFCIGCIGLIIYICENLSFKNLRILIKIPILVICCYLTFIIKAYILFCLLIPLIVWRYSLIIKRIGFKLFVKRYLWLNAILAFFVFSFGHIKALFQDVSLPDLYLLLLKTRTGFESSTDSDGSSFTLGEFSPTITGFLTQIPKAVNAVIFRPYVWESKKIFSLVAAGESLMFLFIAIFVFYKTGIKSSIKIILNNPDVFFC